MHPPPGSDFPALSSGRIADALVLVQEAWTSLAVQLQYGRLERDWLMYRRLAGHFGCVVVVSSGGSEDVEIVRNKSGGLAPNVRIICNEEGLEPVRFLATVPRRVREMLDQQGCRDVLIKTDQMCSAGTALDILAGLREQTNTTPRRVGLLARGGYHWSWTLAREHGGDSPKTIQAGYDEGELLRHADLVQVTTEKIAFDLRWRFGLSADRVRVVPNFVHVPDAARPMSSRGSKHHRVVLSAGRLSREKRVHVLIEAFAKLPLELRTTTTLRIVGSGPMEDELRQLARLLGVSANSSACGVEFVGRLPHGELMRAMTECRVYAQMSEYEGHPKTILEAMAMGAPTLVADAPGVREHIADGRTGVLCRAEADIVSEQLRELLVDNALAERLSKSAAAETRQLLSFERILPLEIESCQETMRRARLAPSAGHRPYQAGVVRWSPSLLETPAADAAHIFATSIAAYIKRLSPTDAAEFLDMLTREMRATSGEPASLARLARSA